MSKAGSHRFDILDGMMAGKRLDVRMRGIVDNIIFSKTEVWAYYEVDTGDCDFMSDASNALMLSGMSQSFAGMMAGRDERVGMHLIVANTPVDIDEWESQSLEIAELWDMKPGFNKCFATQVAALKSRRFMSRKIYIGVRMMGRHSVNSTDFRKTFAAGWEQVAQYAKDYVFAPAGIDDSSISDKEIMNAKETERTYYDSFNASAMKVRRPEAEELALLAKRTFYPCMPTPYLDAPANGRWGKGNMIRELGADMALNRRWVEITQELGGEQVKGYRATLTFSHFPETASPAAPWIYMLQKMGLPFDMYARFELVPSGETQDGGTGKTGNIGLEGTYRMILTSDDVSELERTVEIMRSSYADNGITLTWTAGDQQDLMLESMPGDTLREQSFIQSSDIRLG